MYTQMETHTAGRLDILIGSMFSSKTEALLRKLSQLSEMGMSAAYLNHGIDNRAVTAFSTHSPILQDQELNITALKTVDLSSLQLDGYDVIGIDEAQFFGPDLIDFVRNLVEAKNKYVLVAGLDGDFRRQKFGHILDLVPLADNVTKLHAYCKRCVGLKKGLRPALFTHYMAEPPTVTKDGDNVIVGGAEKYQAMCRACYLELQ